MTESRCDKVRYTVVLRGQLLHNAQMTMLWPPILKILRIF